MPNSTTGAAGAAARAKQMAAMAKSQALNESTAKYFATGVLGMVLIFTIAHWSRFMYSRFASKGVRNSGLMKLQVSVAR
jgi:N-acetylglutamate synthase/N-acetylornithine aminotransferase